MSLLKSTLKFCPCALLFAFAAYAGTDITTRNYNNQRTGANLTETVLNTSNVNANQFGKLFSLAVDDQVYAGILYVSDLTIAGVQRNVVFAATVNNSVYAFDADRLGDPLWVKNFNNGGRPTKNTEVGGTCGKYKDFSGNIGIVGTPVIDKATLTMYFVTRTVESGATVQRLHAINITTGNEQPNSPKVIQAIVPGTGEGGTQIVFNSLTQNQRSGLTLSQGAVYIAWAAFCDTQPYHGWVISYDASTLTQIAAFNTTPNGGLGGIWAAGAAPAVDSVGNLYASTGNGAWDGIVNLSESLFKIAPRTLNLLDYFTASNYSDLNKSDQDFGSGGPSLVPGTNLLVTGSKEGKVYLIDTTNLGKVVAGDTQLPQVFQAVDVTVRPSSSHHIHNTSVFWNSPQGLNLYVWGENDYLRGYRFDTTTRKFQLPSAITGTVLPSQGMPGGMMTVSASASTPGTGIVWATTPRNGDANNAVVPGNLYASNAETLALLWSSTGTGQDIYNFTKGSPPVVANGKVYAASLSGFVHVFGLRSEGPVNQNLAFGKTATGTTPCSAGQTPDKAVNGSFSLGLDDKWCSTDPNPVLTIDLGATYSVKRFIVEHAGAGGESFNSNTASFSIQTSVDGTRFTNAVNVFGNDQSITTHDIAATNARYVRLVVRRPTQSSDPAARIYELQVF